VPLSKPRMHTKTLNKLICFLTIPIDCSCWMLLGRVFHSVDAALSNCLSPNVG
jgi:hypothetical protein